LTGNKSDKTLEAWRTVAHWIGKYRQPLHLDDINAKYVLLWQSFLDEADLSPTSISSYSTRLRAALNWAQKSGLIEKAPPVHCQVCDTPRSRPITGEEFDRLLANAEKARPGDYQFERFLRGLWESGFRLSELYRLSWEPTAPIHLDGSGRYPVVVFEKGSHKAKRRYVQPITPEFWDLCCETAQPKAGKAFPVPCSRKYLGDVISKCGDGIVTNTETGKTASAHDLRRSFAKRMKNRVPREQLGKWTRHNDNSTLENYYLQEDAQELAACLWEGDDE
jgi:integrase